MKRLLVLIGVLALVAAACSSSSDDETTTTVAAAAGGDTPTTAAAVAGEMVVCAVDEVDGDLSLYNWSEYIEPELVTEFEAAYGVTVTETFYDSNEAMLAQVEAGGANYDVIVPSDYMVTIMSEEGLVQPLSKDAVPNLVNLDSQFDNVPYDPSGEFSVPYQWGTTGIGFSYEEVDDAEGVSWAVIFDPETSTAYAGQISLLNDPRETMGAALKYLGYSVNTTDQTQLDEATALVSETKERLATFDSDAFEDLLVEGQTVVAHGYSGDFFSAFDDASTDDYDAYEDFGYAIPLEGGVKWVDTMAIPTTAEHPCTAHTFINFILDAENGAALTNFNYYASPNLASTEFIIPEILEDETIYPSDEVLANLEFLEDTGDFEINYTDAFAAAKG